MTTRRRKQRTAAPRFKRFRVTPQCAILKHQRFLAPSVVCRAGGIMQNTASIAASFAHLFVAKKFYRLKSHFPFRFVCQRQIKVWPVSCFIYRPTFPQSYRRGWYLLIYLQIFCLTALYIKMIKVCINQVVETSFHGMTLPLWIVETFPS